MKIPSMKLPRQIEYDIGRQINNSMPTSETLNSNFLNLKKIMKLFVPFGLFPNTADRTAFISEKIKEYENNYIPQLIGPIQKDWETYRSIYKNMNEQECFLEFLKIKIFNLYLDFFNLKIENSKDIENAEAFFKGQGKIFKGDLISIFNNIIPNQIHLIQEMIFQDYKPKNITIKSKDDEDEITYKNEILSDEIQHFCQWFKDFSGLYQEEVKIFSGAKALIQNQIDKPYKMPFEDDNKAITIGNYSFNQLTFIEKFNYIYLVADSFKNEKISINTVDYTININQKFYILSKIYKLLDDYENEDQESVKKFHEKSILINNNKIFADCTDAYWQLKCYLDLFNYTIETNKTTNKLELMDSSNKFNPVVVEKIKKAQAKGLKGLINLEKKQLSLHKFLSFLIFFGSTSAILMRNSRTNTSNDDDKN
jgi:hypothetical protein